MPPPSVISLEEAKSYLRVTHALEDDKIWGFCTAAYAYIEKFLDAPDITNGDSPLSYPEGVRQAAFMIVGDWYEMKDPTSNSAVTNLLHLWREEMGI